eukprot:552278-Hanusia_phi.AAC.7
MSASSVSCKLSRWKIASRLRARIGCRQEAAVLSDSSAEELPDAGISRKAPAAGQHKQPDDSTSHIGLNPLNISESPLLLLSSLFFVCSPTGATEGARERGSEMDRFRGNRERGRGRELGETGGEGRVGGLGGGE